jgi:hemoglobin-like flavoprotein
LSVDDAQSNVDLEHHREPHEHSRQVLRLSIHVSEGAAMEPDKALLVQQSLGRCLLNKSLGKDFLDAFYDELLASDPRIKPLFVKTDMAKQKELLKHGLTMLIMYSSGVSLAKSAIQQLAVKHDRAHLSVDPGLYRFWIQSLLRCVKKYDPKYDDSLGKEWTSAIELGISVMTQAY